MTHEKIHFVTGRLAEAALRDVVESVSEKVGFQYSIQVLPITVAALLTPKWIADRIEVPPGTTRILLPGYAGEDLQPIRERVEVPVELGPKDLRRLPEFFGQQAAAINFDDYEIAIIAEINHAPRYEVSEIVAMARQLVADGANFVDIGCEPNGDWTGVGECVRAVAEEGIRVSVDSLNPREIDRACQAGAELVLSVNSSNREAAADWGAEVVVIPDEISEIRSLESTMEFLEQRNVRFRIDPILEPIGFGFATSLQRYMSARARWPEVEMMMGIGNLTELTDVDSAGVNMLLLAICQELKIHSVLTTQVINWARTAVKEIDIARRLVHHSITNRVPPKRLSDDLICLRDARLLEFGMEKIEQLAELIKDSNYRIFAENNSLHLLGGGRHFESADPFELFDALAETSPKNLDASHAFYLGYELCKAKIASVLGKQYTQDEALQWGYLTEDEKNRHRLSKKFRR